jgi:hypothetical protein
MVIDRQGGLRTVEGGGELGGVSRLEVAMRTRFRMTIVGALAALAVAVPLTAGAARPVQDTSVDLRFAGGSLSVLVEGSGGFVSASFTRTVGAPVVCPGGSDGWATVTWSGDGVVPGSTVEVDGRMEYLSLSLMMEVDVTTESCGVTVTEAWTVPVYGDAVAVDRVDRSRTAEGRVSSRAVEGTLAFGQGSVETSEGVVSRISRRG